LTVFAANNLDEFIAETDRLGGPGTKAATIYWGDFSYVPEIVIDQSLDPFSDDYFKRQIELYRELSGRELSPGENELTQINIDDHVEAQNPYALVDPSKFVIHYLRLGFMVHDANLPHAPKILDMGAGWGLSSEFLAMLGATVHSVDVNPDFVELIRRRQARHRLPITSEVSTFEDFDTTETYDAIIFYECLHHAAKPWELFSKARRWLKDGGKILFAGEPVNDLWSNWGLRLDAQSVYCIRKFGWFESGWSKAFITRCFWRNGFSAAVDFYPNREVGYVCVAKKLDPTVAINAREMQVFLEESGEEWHDSGAYLVSTGDSTFDIPRALGAKEVFLEISNFRGALVPLKVYLDDQVVYDSSLAPGTWTIKFPLRENDTRLRFVSEPWVPAAELGSGDTRSVSLFFSSARFA